MSLFALVFVLAVGMLQTQATLPPLPLCAALLVAATIMLAAAFWRQWRKGFVFTLLVTAACAGGYGWAGWRANVRLADALPTAEEGRDRTVTGTIVALPERIDRGWRFEFAPDGGAGLPQRVLLSWYAQPYREDGPPAEVPPLHPGDRWQLTVRLKRPHGNANPDGFDYEGWLFERGIRATGYVRVKADNRRLGSQSGTLIAVERLREDIRRRFEAALLDAPYVGVLTALTVGDQQQISAGQWDVFSRTGITHLISISGLHITMLAGLAYALASWLWRRSGYLVARCPAQRAAVIASMATAFLYCLLAGFGIPAQRTLWMLAVVAFALWSARNVASRHVLALALLAVVVVDPWAVVAAGFWLSFGAVALLFYVGGGRIGELHWFAAWGRAQWAITLGLIPLLLVLFQQFSLVSPLANAVAIPVVSFLVTPLALLAAVPGFEFLLQPAHGVLALLMLCMEWLSALPHAVWQQHMPAAWMVGLAAAGVIWLLMPRGFPLRYLGVLAFLPLLLLPAQRPQAGELTVTVLDVGQGLAVHVQTANHDLLFDAGPVFTEEADSGNRIIVPYLRAAGVAALDGMIVSHADRDHSGGAGSVVDAMPVAWLQTSAPFEDSLSALPVSEHPCIAGESWEWDGVRFAILHPTVVDYAEARKRNDMSCVLRLETAYGSLLLTSDIEALSERALLERQAPLRSSVLVAPHHGSGTSSTPAFVAAVDAHAVIFPVGYRNRFGHPRADVYERYSAARRYRTDADGAVTVRYSRDMGVTIMTQRKMKTRYWQAV